MSKPVICKKKKKKRKNISICRLLTFFFSKNTREFDIVLTWTVNILTTNNWALMWIKRCFVVILSPAYTFRKTVVVVFIHHPTSDAQRWFKPPVVFLLTVPRWFLYCSSLFVRLWFHVGCLFCPHFSLFWCLGMAMLRDCGISWV